MKDFIAGVCALLAILALGAPAQAADWKRALVLFRAMEASGVERNTVTYTGAINACAEGMQLDKAMTLRQWLREIWRSRTFSAHVAIQISGKQF